MAPTPVVHVKPTEVVHAAAYLEMKAHYLEVGTYEDPDALANALDDRPGPIQLAASYTRTNQIPPPLWYTEVELRPLAERFFRAEDVELMLRGTDCEAGDGGGRPFRVNVHAKNPNSTASGAFQHLDDWFLGLWGVTGVFDPFDPVQSFKAAADLLYNTKSGINNWNESRHCWG